jgi:ammonia channel protein AmtB
MDDFQGSRVFMFGAGFGLALLLLYNKFQPIIKQQRAQYTDTLSSFLTLLGTAFVISLFYFVLDSYTLQSKEYALLNIYFAFSGSIVSSIAISCIIDGVITFHTVNLGIISGVIQISIIGGFIRTPFVSLLVGAFAGIVTSLLLHFVQRRINNTQFRDIKGVIVIYLINSFLCSYFISPIIIKAYKNVDSSITQN